MRLLAIAIALALTAQQQMLFERVRQYMPPQERTTLRYAVYRSAFVLYKNTPGASAFHVLGSCHLSYVPGQTPPLRIDPTGCVGQNRLDLFALGEYDRVGIPRPWNLGLVPDPLYLPVSVSVAARDRYVSASQRSVIAAVLSAMAPADRHKLLYVIYRSTLFLVLSDSAKNLDWRTCDAGFYILGSANAILYPCKNGGPSFEHGTHLVATVPDARLSKLDVAVRAAYDRAHVQALWTRPWGYFF